MPPPLKPPKLTMGDGLVPLDAATCRSASACRGGYAPGRAVESDSTYWCTQYGDDFGNPEPLWWSVRVPGGYLLSKLLVSFVVDARAHLVAPSAVHAAVRRKGDRPVVVPWVDDEDEMDAARTPGATKTSVTLAYKTTADLFTEKDDVLKLRMTRPGAALGGYVGLARVQLFGTREADDEAVAEKEVFAIALPGSRAMFRFADGAREPSLVENANTKLTNAHPTVDEDEWTCDALTPAILPTMARATLHLKLHAGAGFARTDGVVVGVFRGACSTFKDLALNPSTISFRCRDGAMRDGRKPWDEAFQTAAVPTPEGYYRDGDVLVLEYDRDTATLSIKDDRGFGAVMVTDLDLPTNDDPLHFFVVTRSVQETPRKPGVFRLWRPLSRSDSSRFGSFLDR